MRHCKLGMNSGPLAVRDCFESRKRARYGMLYFRFGVTDLMVVNHIRIAKEMSNEFLSNKYIKKLFFL